MPDIAEILRTGGNGWFYLPIAVVLGALHGLEPGHSKTMMAAYIVAIRGTVGQAVLLGVCAALSHSLVVWVVAMVGLTLGREVLTTNFEAWLLIASGVIILAIAAWMLWRTGQSLDWFRPHPHHSHHHHEHDRDHEQVPADHHHDHDDEDAHERAHAAQMARQLASRSGQVTTGQIALFGITGGLIPCPASITVLLICLQLGQFTLGVATVAAFSLGLAITLVTIGVAAAWGVHHASKRISLSDRILRRLPLASAGLVASLGLVMLIQGFNDLAAPAAALG
jgi:ABC-type nickel/cobalt efflux system permease component RcnA